MIRARPGPRLPWLTNTHSGCTPLLPPPKLRGLAPRIQLPQVPACSPPRSTWGQLAFPTASQPSHARAHSSSTGHTHPQTNSHSYADTLRGLTPPLPNTPPKMLIYTHRVVQTNPHPRSETHHHTQPMHTLELVYLPPLSLLSYTASVLLSDVLKLQHALTSFHTGAQTVSTCSHTDTQFTITDTHTTHPHSHTLTLIHFHFNQISHPQALKLPPHTHNHT